MKTATLEWTDKGEGDWQVAQRESKASIPVWDVVCFLAQQCAEKYLKALLEEYGIAFPKAHDLVLLLELIDSRVTELEQLGPDLAFLSPLAIASRYPGMTADDQLAKQALEIAGKVRQIIRLTLGLK